MSRAVTIDGYTFRYSPKTTRVVGPAKKQGRRGLPLFWPSVHGPVLVSSMSDTHLLNAINHVRRFETFWRKRYWKNNGRKQHTWKKFMEDDLRVVVPPYAALLAEAERRKLG